MTKHNTLFTFTINQTKRQLPLDYLYARVLAVICFSSDKIRLEWNKSRIDRFIAVKLQDDL